MSDVVRVGFVQKQGTTFANTLPVQDDDGDVLDLTNWTGRMELRTTPSSTTVIYSATTANGGVVCGNGIVELNIPATAMQSILPGVYCYDVIAVSPDGVTVLPIREGRFLVTPEVSQPGTGGPTVLVPTTLLVSPTSMTLTGSARTSQITPTVKDQNGNPMSGQTVVYASSNAAAVSVSSSGLVTALVGSGSATITATVPGTSLSATIAVTTQTIAVQSVVVTPTPVALSGGLRTQQLAASVIDQFGNPVASPTVSWSSSDTGHVTVSSSGLVTAIAGGGNVTITATSSGVNGTATVTTAAAVVTGFSVTPSPVALTGGSPTQQLSTAITDQYGNSMSGTVTWSSSDPTHVTVSGSGLLIGVAGGGAVTITATVNGTQVSQLVLVTTAAAVPTTASVTPGSASLTGGAPTRQLTATALDQFGGAMTGIAFTWASSDTAHVTVSSSGLATAISGGGSSTVTATVAGTSVNGTATVTTAAAVATSMTLAPLGPISFTGTQPTQQETPTVKDQFGGVMTGQAITWSSSNSAFIAVNSSGLISVAQGGGSATITATVQSTAVTATVAATSAASVPTTVTLSPTGPLTLTNATPVTVTATVKDQYGFTMNGQSVTWASTNSSGISVNSSGAVQGILAAQTATISATAGSVSGSLTAATNVAAATAIVLSPAGPLSLTATQQETATVNDQYGNAMSGQTVTWSSNDTAHVTVSSSGLITAIAGGGNATITATDGSVNHTLTVTTPAAVATTIVLSPAGPVNLPNLTPVTVSAVVKDQYGNTMGGQTISWSSSNSGQISVNSSGAVQAVLAGASVTITATDGSASATLTATTNAAAPTTITLSPSGSLNLPNDTPVTVTPTIDDQYGNVMTSQTITWASTNSSGVSVSSSGVLTALLPSQTATISATDGGAQATLAVTTSAAVLTSISATPSPISGNVGATGQLAVTAFDQYAHQYGVPTTLTLSPTTTIALTTHNQTAQITAILSDQFGGQIIGTPVTWTSNAPASVSVSATGVVTALKTGATVTITVVSGGLTAFATVTTPAAVPQLTLSPGGTVNLPNLTPVTITPTVTDQFGAVIGSGDTIVWSSSNASGVTVNSSGVIAAVNGSQSVTITANDTTRGLVASLTATTNTPVATSLISNPSSVTGNVGGNGTLSPTTLDQYGQIFGSPRLPTTLIVSPSTATLVGPGTTQQLTATVKDQIGNVMSGQTVTWASSATGVATVNSSGIVTTVGGGTATITGTDGSASGTCVITVLVVTTIVVSPAGASLTAAGQQQQLTAAVKDQNGNPITGQTLSWSSNSTPVATVNASGLVTEQGAGTAVITAAIGSVSGSSTITCTVPGGGSSGGGPGPNLPSGMTAVIDTGKMTALPANGSTISVNGVQGAPGGNWNSGTQGAIPVEFTSTGPTTMSSTGFWAGNLTRTPSPDTGIRLYYQTSLEGGNSPDVYFAGLSQTGTGKIYVRWRIRYSPGWTNNGNVGTKINQLGTPNSTNHYIGGGDGDEKVNQYLGVGLQNPTTGSFSCNLFPAQGNGAPNAVSNASDGNWHYVETLLQQEAIPGQATGTIDMWIDGTHILSYTGIQFLTSGETKGWNLWKVDPTFGGGGFSPPAGAQPMYMDLDEVYVAVA